MKLNEPIGFGSKPGASKQGPFPEKTTINLVGAETTRGSLLTQIALFAIVLALAGIFAKFAVIDPLASGLDSNSEVAAGAACCARGRKRKLCRGQRPVRALCGPWAHRGRAEPG